jgi:hypothetical protein
MNESVISCTTAHSAGRAVAEGVGDTNGEWSCAAAHPLRKVF